MKRKKEHEEDFLEAKKEETSKEQNDPIEHPMLTPFVSQSTSMPSIHPMNPFQTTMLIGSSASNPSSFASPLEASNVLIHSFILFDLTMNSRIPCQHFLC